MRHLIITADDFGLSVEINQAVEAAHRFGTLSAASLMVGGAAAADAIARARALPSLRVGLHVVLVDGAPVLPPEKIPDLVDDAGLLRCDLVRFAADIACRPKVRGQLRAELAAQFAAFAGSGLRLDHVDVHKHFHLHPLIAHEIIAVARRCGASALRIPNESRRVLAPAAQNGAWSGAWLGLGSLLLAAQAHAAGLAYADGVFGLAWSGALTADRLVDLLRHLPSGLIEIFMHPAVSENFPGHADGYRYREEFEALMSPAVADALRRSGFTLGGYCDALSPGSTKRS